MPVMKHFLHDPQDRTWSEIETAVEVLHRVEDLAVAQIGIMQRRDLHAALVDQLGILGIEPAVLDRRVDLLGEAKIVGGDDQAAQVAGSRCARRKAKNSMPSRRRRFIICGLLTISPTIAAIFGARK